MMSASTKKRIGDAAMYTGFSRKTLRSAVERGELHPTRPTGPRGHYYFDTAELDRWLDAIKSPVKR